MPLDAELRRRAGVPESCAPKSASSSLSLSPLSLSLTCPDGAFLGCSTAAARSGLTAENRCRDAARRVSTMEAAVRIASFGDGTSYASTIDL